MKLVFIYGPPASGKLTIAEELSKITGITLFHNHMTRNLVKDIYGDKLDQNYSLVGKLRTTILEYCAKNDTDIIFTYCYSETSDIEAVKIYESNIIDNGGEVCYIELTADRNDLIDRVDNEPRKKLKKLTDKAVMKEITQDMSQYSIPGINPLKINTSEVDANQAAKIIRDKLGL